jgi:peptidyl-prolyl cis-trans isomerase SurA
MQDFDIQVNFRREMMSALGPQLRDIVEKLPVGGVSEPYASREGIRLFMLCERVEKPGPLADAEETKRRLQQQKLELEAQKYMRNLRREASIEVRLGRNG